jgi:hypothetical protein
MSKCHLCAAPDTGTVLIKVQWFGRGTKWLCLDCLRVASTRSRGQGSPGRPRNVRAAGTRIGDLDAPAGRDFP